VRRLPSGRYQARYRLDGLEYLAEETFRTQREADEYLAAVRADIQREPSLGGLHCGHESDQYPCGETERYQVDAGFDAGSGA